MLLRAFIKNKLYFILKFLSNKIELCYTHLVGEGVKDAWGGEEPEVAGSQDRVRIGKDEENPYQHEGHDVLKVIQMVPGDQTHGHIYIKDGRSEQMKEWTNTRIN